LQSSRADTGLTRREFGALPIALAAHAAPVAGRRKWKIFVVQHSHIDVGYTQKQEVIADYRAQFLREVLRLAYSPEQRRRPEEARFKWTCEGFWAVEQFLAQATAAERARLVGAMKEGLVELTAAYFHMTELSDMGLLRRSVSYAARFARQEGLPLQVAMECDINGLSWGMADAYAEVGVKYLSMNTNPHHGGYLFGHPLVPFQWESPAGKRLLTWNGLTYHKANQFGLMGGVAPDTDPGIPGFVLPSPEQYVEVKDISFAERRLLPYLDWLEKTGYPYDFLLLTGSGVYTDNSPAGDAPCRLTQDWNQKHGDEVQVRTATLREFFAHVEKNARELPVYRGEWTDWWSEGVASAPVDTLIYRNAFRVRRTLDMLDPRRELVADRQLEAIDRKLLLYAEHTFGYSHPQQTSLLVQQVFARKTKHAVDADELANVALLRVLHAKGEGEFKARRPYEYTVLNPLTAPVRSVAYLPIDSWEAPIVHQGFRVVDERGVTYEHQVEHVARGWTVAVRVDLGGQQRLMLKLVAASPLAEPAKPERSGFENEYYRVAWTPSRGIVGFVDKATGQNVLDCTKLGALGSPVYQVFPNGNRQKAGRTVGTRIRPHDETTAGKCTAVRCVIAGPVYERWEFQYEVPNTPSYVLSATFFHGLPQIELTASLQRLDVRDPEGMYVLFPLADDGGVWYLDKPGAPIRPGLDQLPKACCDYYCIQHGAALVGPRHGVALATLDAPLVDIGAIRLWSYSTSIEPKGPLYSWLSNNKWETNFRLSCGGAYEFRYLLHASTDFTDAKAAIERCRTLSYPPLTLRG
jgi:hypothetical protein